MRTLEEIDQEIIARLGFLPPFFKPAFSSPAVLENLWQQTVSAYLDNPLPALFKEKLAAVLGRYCPVPYCLACHASSLRPLGMSGPEVLALLESGTDGDEVLELSVAIFLNRDVTASHARLREMLGDEMHAHLVMFIAYNRTCLSWAEANPEIAYVDDGRVRTHLGPLIEEEPRLAEYLQIYRDELTAADDQEKRQGEVRILESVTDAFYALDADWRFTYVNAQAERLLMRSRDELIGTNIWEEFKPAVGSIFQSEYELAARERVTTRFETFYPPLDRWFEVRAYPNGGGLSVYFTDITERRAADLALRASEERFRSLADAIPQIVWTTDGKGEAEYFNAEWERYTGLPKEAGLGHEWTNAIHPDDADRVRRIISDVVSNGSGFQAEFRMLGRGGTYRWMLARGLPVRGADGTLAQYIGTTTDIEDQKRAAEIIASSRDAALAEREQLYSIFEQAPVAIAVRTGPDLVFDYVNPMYQRSVGVSRELVGRSLRDAFPDVDDDTLAKSRIAYDEKRFYMLSEHPLTMDWNGDGKPFMKPVTMHYQPLRDAKGEVTGLISMFFDVSEQVESRHRLESTLAELQVERDLRDRFVATLTHDLRSPLTAAKMGAQMILRRSGDADTCSTLAARIVSGMERADRMIRDLLDANRVRAGEGMELDMSPTELSSVVRAAMDDLMTVHGDRFDVRLEPWVEGTWNAGGLRRVVENLVNNAIKYGDPYSRVRVSVTRGQGEAVLEVHNEGRPISREDQATIFEPFKRASSAEASKGWGLGLTLVKGVVDAHRGQISLRSDEGHGTTFSIRLPAELRANPTAGVREHDLGPGLS